MDLETDGAASLAVEWRQILKDIDDELDTHELAAMCFLCRDHIPGAKLEKITRGLDLLSELESKGVILSMNSRFLLELLFRVGRFDLLRRFSHNRMTVQMEVQKCGSCFKPFRLLLQYFCDELTTGEVEQLRFLAATYVAKNKLQDIETPQKLFIVLEKTQVILPEDVSILKQMTTSLDRRDLFEKVIEYEALCNGIIIPPPAGLMTYPAMMMQQQVPYPSAGVPAYPGTTPAYPGTTPPSFNPYSSSVLPGSDKHGYSGPASMCTVSTYSDPPPPYTPPLTPLHHAKPQPTGVQDIMIDRALTPPADAGGVDKAQLAADLQREAEEMVRVRQIQRLQELSLNGGSKTPPSQQGAPSDRPVEADLKKGADELKREFLRERKETDRRSKDLQRRKSDRRSDDMPCYKMNAKPRGICLVINNRNFYQMPGDLRSKNLPTREGTELDAKNLNLVWRKLHFVVENFNDLTDQEMMRTLAHYAFKVNHSQFDCFVCCILTHGATGGLYGVNGKFLEIKDVTACFKAVQCPSLAGKPKLFFLQACQGRLKMPGLKHLQKDSADDDLDSDAPGDMPPETIPNEADFLLGYATLPGFVSYRSRSMGSWYITKLCEVLDKYSYRYDLLSILIKVNEEVGKAVAQVEDQSFKQTPAPMVALRKKIYFL